VAIVTKAPQQSLKDWTAQKWRTSDGKLSEGKKRYLPDAAWKSLSPAEKAATNRAKASGNAKGKQFVAQPKRIAAKTAKYR
jgi:Tfp pilus assembly protein FimT